MQSQLDEFFTKDNEKGLETQDIELEDLYQKQVFKAFNDISAHFCACDTQYQNLNEDQSEMEEKQFDLYSTSFASHRIDTWRNQSDLYYELSECNRNQKKLNDLQQKLLVSLNRQFVDNNIFLYVENDLLFVKFSILRNFEQEEQNFIEQQILQKIKEIFGHQSILRKIIDRDVELRLLEDENIQFKNSIAELKKCNLRQEYQSPEQLNGERHYFIKEIQLIQKQKNLLTYQYINDNNLYQSSCQEMELYESFYPFPERLERISQFEFDECGNRTIKLLTSYGIDCQSHVIYKFSDGSQNLEQFLNQNKTTLHGLLEIIISVIKALILLHSQKLSHGKLCGKAIYLNKRGQAKLDILHYLQEKNDKKFSQYIEFEKDIQDLGLLIEYLLIKNIIFIPMKEGIFLNCFGDYVMDIIKQCKIQDNSKQPKLAGLLQWFNRFLQVFEMFTKIKESV